MKDPQSRKYQLTLNNPQDKGLSHEAIKKILEELTALEYYCMADEIWTCQEKWSRKTHKKI